MRTQLIKILGLPAKASDKSILDRARMLADAFTANEAESEENREINRMVHDSVNALSHKQGRSVLQIRRQFAADNPRLADSRLPLAKRLNVTRALA